MGASFTCALNTQNRLYCWVCACEEQPARSRSTSGISERTIPRSCALKHTCTPYTLQGLNNYGMIGDGSTANGLIPVPVSYEYVWLTLATGASHTCAIRSDFSLWCWVRGRLLGGFQCALGLLSWKSRCTPLTRLLDTPSRGSTQTGNSASGQS